MYISLTRISLVPPLKQDKSCNGQNMQEPNYWQIFVCTEQKTKDNNRQNKHQRIQMAKHYALPNIYRGKS